jgi:hypothetical protein
LSFDTKDVRIRDVDSFKIELIWLNLDLDGSWVAKSEHHLYIDDVFIARDYIGTIL